MNFLVLFVGAEFREKVCLVRIYQVSRFGESLLRLALSFLALGYLLVTSYLKFAKLKAMMFLAQLQFKTFLPSFFFFLPPQSALEKLLREALALWVFGRNHDLCQRRALT